VRQILLNSSKKTESRKATLLFQLIRLADKNLGLRSCRIPDTAGNQDKQFLLLIYFQVNIKEKNHSKNRFKEIFKYFITAETFKKSILLQFCHRKRNCLILLANKTDLMILTGAKTPKKSLCGGQCENGPFGCSEQS